MRVLAYQKDVKVEQGALRVTEPGLKQAKLELIRKLGVSGTRSSHCRRHKVWLLSASLDACALLAPHL
jgi:hypothetical protein